MGHKRLLGRTCACGSSIVDINVSGRCKPCHLKRLTESEETREKIRLGMKRYCSDPVNRARLSRIRSDNQRKARAADPERWAAQGRANLAKCRTPEAEAKRIASLRASCAKTKMSWCPEAYRDEYYAFYRSLLRNKRIPYMEARKAVLDEIAKREAKRTAELSPFERQNRALERGATLYEAAPRATLDRPGVYRS